MRVRTDSNQLQGDASSVAGLLAVCSTHLLVVDRDLTVATVSGSFRNRFLVGADPVGERLRALIAAHQQSPATDVLSTALEAALSGHTVRVVCGTGWSEHEEWFDVSAIPLPSGGGAMVEATDVTEFVQAARAVRPSRLNDRLTGLLTRPGLIAWLDSAFAAESTDVCVAMLQIDQFDVVEHALGEVSGDDLLRQVAGHVVAAIPPGAIAARTGRATFCVAYPSLSKAAVDAHASSLRDAVRLPVTATSRTMRLTGSVGTTFARADGSPDRFLREAETAMQDARRRGGNRYAHYAVEDVAAEEFEMRKWDALREALQYRQLEVWFQPIVSLATGRGLGAEALSRWHHPHYGEISPSEFIPLAEWGAEITRIGSFVHECATDIWRALRTDRRLGLGRGEFQISMNTSPHELAAPHFALNFLGRLQVTASQADWFALEITEEVLMEDDPNVRANLRALAHAGVTIAVHDFGTRHSSVERLLELPVRRVKIARRFIATLPTDPLAERVVATTVAMAHELGIDVVAEGVETAEQVSHLIRLGCSGAQGYFFAPAVPKTELADVLVDLAANYQSVGR